MTNQQRVPVLYISYDGMTDPLGQSQVLPYLCGLSEKGYAITLLSCEKPERYTQYRSIIEDICLKAGINWQPIPYTSRPPVLSTIKDVRALQSKAFALHNEHQFKIVHCRSYISALIGQKMKRKFGTKFLFDMRGFWADERVDGELWNLNNPLYKTIYSYFKRKEKEYLEQADHIISLTHLGKDEIHSWKKIKGQPVPISVIPCCVDTTLFNPAAVVPEQQQQLLNKLHIPSGSLVIGYVGSIGTWYMLDEMLQFFKIFKQKNSEAIILFVTTEPESMVREAAVKLGIDAAAIIVQPAARKEVPLYISIMNYSLFFIKPRFSKKASSPTKQGEIMAMGIPTLCNTGVGDTGFVVHKYHSGVAIDDFYEATFANAVHDLQHTTFSASDIRKGAIDFYGLEKGIELYSGVYQQLLS
jgi:glycosyltransferase involved in cell wall biosynthesis